MRDRPKTEREEALDEIIEEAEAAKDHLARASRIATSVGDKDGAKDLEEAAENAERIEKKYEGVRDKKSG